MTRLILPACVLPCLFLRHVAPRFGWNWFDAEAVTTLAHKIAREAKMDHGEQFETPCRLRPSAVSPPCDSGMSTIMKPAYPLLRKRRWS